MSMTHDDLPASMCAKPANRLKFQAWDRRRKPRGWKAQALACGQRPDMRADEVNSSELADPVIPLNGDHARSPFIFGDLADVRGWLCLLRGRATNINRIREVAGFGMLCRKLTPGSAQKREAIALAPRRAAANDPTVILGGNVPQ